MQLFYHPSIEMGKTVVCEHDESKHLKALRMKDGDRVLLTDGKGKRFIAAIEWKKYDAHLTPLDSESVPPFSPALTLAIAPTKNADRLEWFVEKAVEIGVSKIILVHCENAERPIVKLERLQRVAISAMKQSLKFYLPEITALVSFKTLLAEHHSGMKCIAHCADDAEKKLLKNILPKGSDALICIGPEGDFSAAEVALAKQNGFLACSLGNSRLRTETAGMAAVHTFDLIQQ